MRLQNFILTDVVQNISLPWIVCLVSREDRDLWTLNLDTGFVRPNMSL